VVAQRSEAERAHRGGLSNDQAIWNLPHPNDPQAIRSYFETYAYDKVGNILEMFHNAGGGANTWTRTYNYGSGSPTNRLVSHNIPSGTATYSYDNHGSMTSMPHLSSMSWTPFDQMQSANKGGGGIVYFTYGADGQRVRKVWDKTASLREERIYLGGYEVYREKTSGVTQLERQTLHVMDGAKRLAMVETKTISGGAAVTPLVSMFRYQLGNHLGSAVLEVDAAGLIISYEEYSPYGSSAYRSSRSGVDVSARRYRYIGLERDDETGLYHMGARYYAAWLGRWTSADPLGVGADGPGIYNYTRGSPVTLVDPGGTWSISSLVAQAKASQGTDSEPNWVEENPIHGRPAEAESTVVEGSDTPVLESYEFREPGGGGVPTEVISAGDRHSAAMEAAHAEGLTRASYREAQDRLGIADGAVFAEGVERILLEERYYPEFGPWPTGDQGGRAGDPRESADVAAALDYLPVPGMLSQAAHAAGPKLLSAARVLGEGAKEGALLPLRLSMGVPGGKSPFTGVVRGADGRAVFNGLEVRGMRDLSHVSESTLRAQAKLGFASKDAKGRPMVLHHHEQNPAGPIIEMPAPNHSTGNPAQHPFATRKGAGLTEAERTEFNAWRVDYWKARAQGELNRREL
jgi:RHS repeat-associated protein